MKEMRELEMQQASFSFGLATADATMLPTDTTVAHMKHGTVMYDAINVELHAQAMRKEALMRRLQEGILLQQRNREVEMQLRFE
jgi:hypothetical protein